MLELFTENFNLSAPFMNLIISSVLLIVSIIILRSVIARYIRKRIVAGDLRRRWLVQTRNGLILLMILGLLLIWGEELRTLALSVVAIAVALVVATKELIVCITGSILKTGARSFNIGDRIQIKDFRGDVIDQNFLATTILEVGPGKITHQLTGRMTVIPNSLFVSEPVINESFTNDFVLHVFTIPFKREDNWMAAQEAVLASADKHCRPYLDEVRTHMNRLSRQRGLETPSVDPRVTIQVPAAGEVHLVVRIPTKSDKRGSMEQLILSEVFSDNDFSRKESSEPKDSMDEAVSN